MLRRTLLSGLAATVQTNIRRGAAVGLVFRGRPSVFGHGRTEHRMTAGAMAGRWHVAGIAGGRLQRSNWRSDGTQVDFFTLKGVVEDLLEAIGARDVVFQPADRTAIRGGNGGRGVAPRHGFDRLHRRD